jgi:glycosyltransferase involved in cell wall biosynthesis
MSTSRPRRYLFLHQNFPGQFRHLALRLAQLPGHQVVSIGQPQSVALPGVQHLQYQPQRQPGQATHRYLLGMEAAVLAGQASASLMLDLRRQGFQPDAVIAHPGWGESLYTRDIFPQAKIFHFCEFYYHPSGADSGFDPAQPLGADDCARLRTRNALHLLNLEQCDVAVTPTWWQRSVHPVAYHDRIQVIHEGVDTALAKPDPEARVTLPDGRVLDRSRPVVTFVARNLEPYRGFGQFLQAAAALQARHPEVEVLLVGADSVSYGAKPQGHASWREKFSAEIAFDPARTHFLGKLPYLDYLKVLQISSAHVYLTYPFVLSWSMLEALSCGCLVLGSRTPPVEEVIEHGRNGLLVDFFDTAALAGQLAEVLAAPPERWAPLRQAARQTVLARYSVEQGCAQWQALLARELQGFGHHRRPGAVRSAG